MLHDRSISLQVFDPMPRVTVVPNMRFAPELSLQGEAPRSPCLPCRHPCYGASPPESFRLSLAHPCPIAGGSYIDPGCGAASSSAVAAPSASALRPDNAREIASDLIESMYKRLGKQQRELERGQRLGVGSAPTAATHRRKPNSSSSCPGGNPVLRAVVTERLGYATQLAWGRRGGHDHVLFCRSFPFFTLSALGPAITLLSQELLLNGLGAASVGRGRGARSAGW